MRFLVLLILLLPLILSDHEPPKVELKEPERRAKVEKKKKVSRYEADLRCLAENIYWEARGEGQEGMLAVAHVTLNRVRHPSWPKSVCSVVYQSSQFSWTSDEDRGKVNASMYRVAVKIAKQAIGSNKDPSNGALYFHTIHINKPRWAHTKEVKAEIGNHVFYR